MVWSHVLVWVLEAAHLLGFSHTTICRVYREWAENQTVTQTATHYSQGTILMSYSSSSRALCAALLQDAEVHVDPATLDSRSLGKYYLVWVLIPAVTERWLDQNLVWTWKQIFILSHTALAVRLLTIKNSSSSWRKRLNSSTSKMYLIRWMVNVTFNSNGLQASSFTFLMFDVMWT